MHPTADFLGKQLAVGQRVAFAALSYRSAHLRVGEVVEVDPSRRDSIRVYSATANRREWRRPDQLIQIA
jgi:hypothetical protein